MVVHLVDLVAQLSHKGVRLASQLRSVLLELLKQFETQRHLSLHALDLLNDSVAGLVGDLNLAIIDTMALLAECLGAKDSDTRRVLSFNNVRASCRDYFLSESRRIEFVQHDRLAVHSVALVWSLILAKVERKVLSLPLWVARHKPLWHVNRSISIAHARLAKQRVNASTSVN